jgi:fission process protein 1
MLPSFTLPRWQKGTPLTISHPLTELKSPRPIACSINDWFKDEANDNEDYDDLKDGPARFAGLMGRVGLVLARTAKAGSRYIAYSSDVGEAFRPLVSPTFVKASYGVAIAYIATDVGLSVYKEHNESLEKEDYNNRVGRAGVETLTFQLFASLLVPSLIIHTAVHQAQNMAKKSTGNLARYGPTALGLAIIPTLPFTIDSPIEHFIEEGFDKMWHIDGYGHHTEATTGAAVDEEEAAPAKVVDEDAAKKKKE